MIERCKNCEQRIELINFAMGPEWRHWPSEYGNYRTSEKYRYCVTSSVAEPVAVAVGTNNEEGN
jgi:hypothetical protein